jgi:DNA-binding LytR/AlgR family response regulator
MLGGGVEVIVGTDEIVPVEHQPGGAIRLLQRSRILYLSAESDYVRIHSESGRHLVRGALGEYERRWTAYGFLRTHRSYLVNMTRAVEIRPDQHGGGVIVMEDGALVPVARRHIGELRRRLALAPAPKSLQSQSS